MGMGLEIAGMAGHTSTATVGAAVIAAAGHRGNQCPGTRQGYKFDEIVSRTVDKVTSGTGVMNLVTGGIGGRIKRDIVTIGSDAGGTGMTLVARFRGNPVIRGIQDHARGTTRHVISVMARGRVMT